MYEIEVHDEVKVLLEKKIKGKQMEIEDLQECLKVPRQHFKNIERL